MSDKTYKTNNNNRTASRASVIADTCLPSEVVEAIEASSRGRYQRALIDGKTRWSGSDLKGTARTYGARYSKSRRNLIARINGSLPADWAFDTAIDPKTRTREAFCVAPDGRRIFFRRS